jgi:hypothetical protein
MIAYQGPGYYYVLFVDKILKIYYYGGSYDKDSKLGAPTLIDNEIKFWEVVKFVIEDQYL